MKILLLDIETAPNKVYTWGLFNQNIAINQIDEAGYTLCWSAKWLDDPYVYYSSLHKDGKAVMLGEIWHLLDEADVVVHYNGTKFDLPTLNQEFITMGWTAPSPVMEVDLLKTVRQRFRLPSNKLSYVCKHLGLGTKIRHKGMELWRECMAGDAKAWKEMEDYNKQDVILLGELYDKLLPWIHNHPNTALFSDSEDMMCPNCGSHNLIKKGFQHTRTMKYQRYRCNDCGSWSRARTNSLPKEKKAGILVGVK